MKVIFVDIDGPLATEGCADFVEKTKWHPDLYRMNPACVKILNEIITETGCELIISSDWRLSFNLEELGEIFEWNGIIKKPMAFTPREMRSFGNLVINRVHQIKLSLTEHNPESWVAIDDLPLGEKFGLTNYVFCDPFEGLETKDAKQDVINFLNINTR